MTCQYFPLKIFYSKKRDGSKLRGTPEVVAAVREKKKVKIIIRSLWEKTKSRTKLK